MMAAAMLIFRAVDRPFEEAPVCDPSVAVVVTSDCVAVELVEPVVEVAVVDVPVVTSVNLAKRVRHTKEPLPVVSRT